MATKYFKKTSNGKIEIPTLKTYNKITVDAFVGKEVDLEFLTPAVYHSLLTGSQIKGWGKIPEPLFYKKDGDGSYIFHTDADKYRIGFLEEQFNEDVPVVSSLTEIAIYLFETISVPNLSNGAYYRWLAGAHGYTPFVNTNGHLSGLFDMYTTKGIEGLSKEDLQLTTTQGYYYAWGYEGSLPILEAILSLKDAIMKTDYDIFGQEATRLGFKFYRVDGDGTKHEIPYNTNMTKYSYQLKFTIDAIYTKESYVVYPLGNLKLRQTVDVDSDTHKVYYNGWVIQDNN